MSPRTAAFACSFLMLGSVACGSTRDAGADSSLEPPVADVDTSDPVMVAEAFYDAVDRKDIEAALVWILPEQQAEVRQTFGIDGMPDLPPGYEVSVDIRDDIGEASIAGTNIKVALLFSDGRWWVCE